MGMKLEDFLEKKELDGIKLYIEDQQAFDVTRNYKIVTPASSLTSPYVTYGNKSELRANCFMQPIGVVNVQGTPERIYEQDIIDFTFENNYRNVGVIVYSKEHFGWKIKAIDTGDLFDINKVTIINVLGSIYEHKAFAGCNLEIIYKLLGKDIPKVHQYAMLDEEIPFHTSKKQKKETPKQEQDVVNVYVDINKHGDDSVSWGYKLEYKENTLSDSRTFKKSINRKEYYIVASTIIALSKLKKPAEIKLYTTMASFADVINNKRLKTWANTDWINKENGEKEDALSTLKELKSHIDRLGGNISAIVVDSIGIAA